MVLDKSHKMLKNKPDSYCLYMQHVMMDFDNVFEMEKLKQTFVKEKTAPKKPGNKL